MNEGLDIRESTIKSEAVFSKDQKHRYLIKRIWDENKPKASIILLNPSLANEYKYDNTSMKAINYLVDNKEYGGIYIVNLYSYIETNSDKVKGNIKRLGKKENDKWIKFAINNSEKVYIAWGSNDGNKTRIEEVINILKYNDCRIVYKLLDKNGDAKHPSICNIVEEEQIDINNIL
ncbi:DUF1643 domain-containing protein [Clostridioides sp. ZZV14-6387]|uniref:DUF1643 domain-containing protein n=1 Tax=Clostridioides sp. ZZV14-6387 TaxID=2811497 RepID=UPI001D120764|nr:DUF1643 domain-containing protein [Clostridioides sp. ZZV14-6387]